MAKQIFNYDIMKIEEYDEMYAFWRSTPGVALHDADKEERIHFFITKNPGQSFTCKVDNRIIGTIMCGNDGRRACIYHLAVALEYRHKGIATKLVEMALDVQSALGIDKCKLSVLNHNTLGKSFWTRIGFAIDPEIETMAKSI